VEKDQVMSSPVWSPDGRWIAYVRKWGTKQPSAAIEVRPAAGGSPKTVLPESSLPESATFGLPFPFEGSVSWSRDWRLLFSAASQGLARFRWPPEGKCSIWAIPVKPRTAEPAGKPERLTQWSDFLSADLTVTADGKRLSYIKLYAWLDLYLGELGPGSSSLKPPRRFAFDRLGSDPQEWTRDSQAILFSSTRNGRREIFRQGLRDSVAEAVVQGPNGN
jgi:Tol biopolymer transport system component